MNARERYPAFANFKSVDRVPQRAQFAPELRESFKRVTGQEPVEHFDMDNYMGHGLRPPDGFIFPDYTAYHPGRKHRENGFTIDSIGVRHVFRGFHHFMGYVSPLRNARRIEASELYPIVSNETWLDDKMRAAGVEVCATERLATIFVGHIMYENAWQVRGYEAFFAACDELVRSNDMETC